MEVRKWILLAAAALAAGGCSSGSGGAADAGNGPVEDGIVQKEELPVVTSQERYTPADFLAKVEGDAALQELWNALKAEGYTDFLAAGVTEQDDGIKVIWGEAFGLSLPFKGLVRHCEGDDCIAAIWRFDGDDAVWEDAEGHAVESRGIGLPVLLKSLEGHTYDKPTHVLRQALEAPPTDLPEIDVTKRRFWAVSSFGPLWAKAALDTGILSGAAEKSGAFDEVREINYARTGDVDNILTHSHPFDVFVWLAQGIREEAKTGKVYKPVGLTVNAGLFGDATYARDRLLEMLDTNPLQGPGLIVLAACESMGDGAGGGELDKSLPVDLDNHARILVGFERCGDARDLLNAVSLFLESWFDGATLGDALAGANVYLAGEGSKAVMKTLPDADLGQVFLKDVSTFWERYTDAGVPGDSQFQANVLIINLCTDKSGKEYQQDESFVSAWSNEMKWQGPFFSGTRKNPENNVDEEIKGALLGIAQDARFFFSVKGSLGPKVQDVVLYGSAVIDEIVIDKKKPDEFTLEFTGQGRASGYVNENGDACVMQPPLLVSSTGEPGKFKIPVAFKDAAGE